MKKEFTMMAQNELLGELLEDLEEQMTAFGWPMGQVVNVGICTEEIYVNIANYGYPDKIGPVTITEEVDENRVALTFVDEGIEYNPLAKPDPDITLSLEERPVGGLGIYMVKNMMTVVDYKYENGKNQFFMALDRE